MILKFVIARAKFYTKWNGGEVVYLCGFSDKLYITIAFKTASNDLDAFTYYDTNTGPWILKPNGTVLSKASTHGYITNWLPDNKYKRVEMILQHGAKAFNI